MTTIPNKSAAAPMRVVNIGTGVFWIFLFASVLVPRSATE
jgi:hypothetical protein